MKQSKFQISNQISIGEVEKIYQNNFEKIIYEFFNLENEWMFNAYKEYKDFDKYIILVYLLHKTLETYNKHFYKISFEKFYNNSHIEIEKISIVDLVKSLSISKETVRRKLNELSQDGILTRKLKNIRINKVISNTRLERNVFNLSKLLFLFVSKLKKEHNLENFTREDLERKIRENYTQYWNLFFKFQINYVLRWKNIYSSIDSFYVWGLCALNEALNSKTLNKSIKENMFMEPKYFHENLTKLKNSKGLNPTTISELSGIPRATVIRKIKNLVKNKFLYKDFQLYKINNSKNSKTFKLQNKNFQKNQSELRIFLKEILNLIKAN
tara:strand:- start:56 stop:1033 length:978 start_codon:yes stop_codon:yes gene_type:complete